MNNNNLPQNNNNNNNVHESNFSGSTITQAEYPSPNNAFGNYNDNFSMNDNVFPVHTPVTSSNNVTISDHNHQQQSMSNDSSTSQSYPQCTGQNLPQSTFTPLNSLNIIINSPQTNIIIMPVPSPTTTNSDMQNQQQNQTYLNNSSSNFIPDISQNQFRQ